MRRANRAALNGEILRINIDRTAVDQAITGHNAGFTVQHVQLHEAGGVQQQADALPGKELSGLLLLSAKLRVTLQDRQLALANHGQVAFNIHIFPSIMCIKILTEPNFCDSIKPPFFLQQIALNL